MKPMLAAKADEATIQFPVLLSPKLDGVRCLVVKGVAVGRSLKPIPNHHVQHLFGSHAWDGLDGELIVGDPTAADAFQRTTSGVMSHDGEPAVRFHVFDDFSAVGGFRDRLRAAERRLAWKKRSCALVEHWLVKTSEELAVHEQRCLALGYEGVMLRAPMGAYKHGRSTAREGWLLKLKRFTDAEAIVLGCTELRRNTNAAVRNATGGLERSHHQAGLVGAATLGALIVRDCKTQVEFEIGTGFTARQRAELWVVRDALIGHVVKYKSQPIGVKERPRFPVFLGFRSHIDIT